MPIILFSTNSYFTEKELKDFCDQINPLKLNNVISVVDRSINDKIIPQFENLLLENDFDRKIVYVSLLC